MAQLHTYITVLLYMFYGTIIDLLWYFGEVPFVCFSFFMARVDVKIPYNPCRWETVSVFHVTVSAHSSADQSRSRSSASTCRRSKSSSLSGLAFVMPAQQITKLPRIGMTPSESCSPGLGRPGTAQLTFTLNSERIYAISEALNKVNKSFNTSASCVLFREKIPHIGLFLSDTHPYLCIPHTYLGFT